MKMKKSRTPPTALYRTVSPVAATSMPLLFSSKMPLAVPSAVSDGSCKNCNAVHVRQQQVFAHY